MSNPPQLQQVQRASWLHALWKFSRPHTIIGTTLSVLGLYLIAVAESTSSIPSPFSILPALLACLCGNVYIVGLNQIQDVEIDRINKPHLPIASGEFSRRQASWIVAITGLLAIGLSVWQGLFLMATVWISLIIGTAYSLPPIRLKRFPFWASLCIFTVRGVVVNLGLFLHFQSLSGEAGVPPSVIALTLFILGYTFAIAIFKDIPDLEGDRLYNITTFTIRLGQRAVFDLARWVITACYLGLMLVGLMLSGVNGFFLVATHALAIGFFWHFSLRVNLQSKSEVARFYQLIWKLFFLEYLLFPAACLLT